MGLKIKLLLSLGAALPFSSDGAHPVYNWTASLRCGHFLGQLFRRLTQTVNEEPGEDGDHDHGDEQVTDVTPASEPVSQHNVRSLRMQAKRQKYLRSRRSRTKSHPQDSHPSAYHPKLEYLHSHRQHDHHQRNQHFVRDDVILEASNTLQTICSDYLSSRKYDKV